MDFVPDPDQARLFALAAHQQQQYDGQPYLVHLQAVVDLVQQHVRPWSPTIVCAAWLHDVLEDTWAKEVDIGFNFGQRVLELVRLLTDEPGRNRRERHALTYPKLRSDPEAVSIKLCDRLANARHSYGRLHESNDNRGLFNMYVREYPEFRRVLWRADECRSLWHELDELLLREEKRK